MTNGTSQPAASNDSLFVGRDEEIAIIDHAIDDLTSGRGQVILLCGEPGIGKSTLARYAANAAAMKKIPVYWGFAWEAGGAPAFWPWTQLLRSLVSEQRVSAAQQARLGQLLPEKAGKPVADLDPAQARFQLLESARALLEKICRDSPVILILEDLHAADVDSLNLLQYIARHIVAVPTLIVGTYRDAEARALGNAEALLRAVRDARVIDVKPLNEGDIRSYLAGQEGARPTDDFVAKLFATTDGNPLFLRELVQFLGSESASGNTQLPKNVQQVIHQQIDLLPRDTVDLLTKASIQGRNFSPAVLADYAGIAPEQVEENLGFALTAGIIKQFDEWQYRFSHALHRDVLYHGIGASDRSELHLAYAEHISKDISTGNADRWTELATHLDAAGAKHKAAAIDAWRNAANRALSRLAFDDAARLLGHALDSFGAGPKFDPAERCRLLLECASATMLAGNIATGQQQCKDAFVIARTLQDAQLMSTAALTWGSAFIVAKVDKDLISALNECLERLPDDDAATRSKVLARLAAALQPAPNPSDPMALARNAIELARTTADDDVLHHVLRSAISALMDFAPVAERRPLNEEFTALAAARGDIPGRFRGMLRLMIDASEAGDRKMMDDAIDSCDQLARRIDLPHYLWRASSARAMQATIEGQFERATQLIDEAQVQADRIDDFEARITLPLQRFAILTEWESDQATSLQQIETQLQQTFDQGLAEAEFFVAPFITAFTVGNDPEVARKLLSNKLLLERVFAGGDRFSLGRTGELAALAGESVIARRAFDACLQFDDECAHLGLMGSVWLGPITYYLGTISAALNQPQEAAAFLRRALDISLAMKAQPFVARIHLALAKAEAELENSQEAAIHRETGERMRHQLQLRELRHAPLGNEKPSPVDANAFVMVKQGDVWRVTLNEQSAVVRDSKGMQMLAQLVGHPNQEFHVLDLAGSSASVADGDAGPVLDGAARAQYKQRIGELQQQLDEARELGDLARADQLQDEFDFISRELARAFGLGGRQRRAGSAAERARVNVRRRIKDAIVRIGEHNPDTRRYLDSTVKTGRYCKYSPL